MIEENKDDNGEMLSMEVPSNEIFKITEAILKIDEKIDYLQEMRINENRNISLS